MPFLPPASRILPLDTHGTQKFTTTVTSIRYLLLQTRNSDDAMRRQEIDCFARRLACDEDDIEVVDLLSGAPAESQLARADVLLLGGSGHYSAASESGRSRPRAEWLRRALDVMRDLHHRAMPTFASCWGFQAMARAMGGRCIHDPANSELGTVELQLTDAGRRDPLFGTLPPEFTGQAGHEDHVTELPPDAVLLASSALVRNQAFCFADKPIYCTQFHPELDRAGLLTRVRAYPDYVERIAGVPYEDFLTHCGETPEANTLLRRFVELVVAR
jgi:GMP synthase (glutamine-hydrolysing)